MGMNTLPSWHVTVLIKASLFSTQRLRRAQQC